MACIEWTGKVDGKGYGYVWDGANRKMHGAHRVAWERVNGPIPDGMYVCHTCDNRICVNTDHMFLGTHRENMEDMARKNRGARSKLTWDDVQAIRSGPERNVDLAKKYGVCTSTISMIRTHKIRRSL